MSWLCLPTWQSCRPGKMKRTTLKSTSQKMQTQLPLNPDMSPMRNMTNMIMMEKTKDLQDLMVVLAWS